MIKDKIVLETLDKISEVIKKKGLTQREVAAKAGITEEQVSRLMNAKNSPLFETVVKIAKGLDIPLVGLFEEGVETSSLIAGLMRDLPDDIVKAMTDQGNGKWLLLGLKFKDTELSEDEINVAVQSYLNAKQMIKEREGK